MFLPSLFVPTSRKNSQPFAGLKLSAKLFEWQVFGQEIARVHTKNFCQKQEFAIRHPAQLRFELADRAEADAPALQLELLGKDSLRPSLAIAEFPHLGANHVQTELHQNVTLPQAAADFTPT